MKHSVLLLLLFLSGLGSLVRAQLTDSGPVRLSETYELANVILALTAYGKTDPWEVARHSAYYREVRAHFDRYAHHPLLEKVNYSREKWESYLSFRTDAYAFAFDGQGRLVRTVDFYANKGFSPFDEHRDLIDDFVTTSGFRQFYRAHQPYYRELASAYLESQRYGEMRHFLEKELGKPDDLTAYAIVLSPLVGRMNCHRVVAGVGTDFITLPDFLLSGKAVRQATPSEIASGTHMLFTELDHAFVNPVSEQYRALLRTQFNARLWDAGSGYDRDSLAAFNEYMTWAVYDLYVQTCFPAVAAAVSQDWALQNATRGFYASSLFNRELTRLYNARRPGQSLRDLYPAFLTRLGSLQPSLRQPLLTDCNLDNRTVSDTVATFIIHFSEPMEEVSSFDLVRMFGQGGQVIRQERLEVTPEVNALCWSGQGRTVQFQLPVHSGGVNYLVFNYPWKTRTALRSRLGIDLKPYSRVQVHVTGGH